MRGQSPRSSEVNGLYAAYGRRGPKTLRVWSAGCSTGTEAYSLSILMNEMAPSRVYFILATDLDRGALQVARARGPYKAEETRNLSPEQRARYLEFEPGVGFFAKRSLAAPIQFAEQDLNADPFDGGFDLIVCRNVIIYFTQETKLLLYQKFQAALRPGGILFLGGIEVIPTPKSFGFHSQDFSFYVKEA